MTLSKKYKILIVDDDNFLLDVYSVKFKEAGHQVLTAFGGEEAIEKVKENDHFDAIVLDVVMPGMDGFELMENLRKNKLAKDSAFVVLTNQSENKDIKRAKEFDIDGYIVKASTIPSDVLREVLNAIKRHKNES